MPSTRLAAAFAAMSLLTHTVNVHASSEPDDIMNSMTYKGCFSSSNGLSSEGSYTYQSSGYCQPLCVGKNDAVLGLSGGDTCWCGNSLPPQSAQVDDSKCDTACNGYPDDMCGGSKYYSVYLSGTSDNVPYAGGSGSSNDDDGDNNSPAPSSDATTAPPSTTTKASPTTQHATIVTSVAPGRTVVITQSAAPVSESSSTASPSESKKKDGGGGSNVAGIAAGVVVGVVAFAAIVGGLFLFARHRKRQAAEADYNNRAQASDFISSGGNGTSERKPPGTGWSTLSDSRLDPEAGKRNSIGSIADDQDYSRRILRVRNA